MNDQILLEAYIKERLLKSQADLSEVARETGIDPAALESGRLDPIALQAFEDYFGIHINLDPELIVKMNG